MNPNTKVTAVVRLHFAVNRRSPVTAQRRGQMATALQRVRGSWASSALDGTASATAQRMAEPQVQSPAVAPTNSGMPTGQIEQQREIIAQQHAHDSSSVATSRADQPRVLLRSPIMWGTLYLPALALIAIVAYMVAHLHAHDPGRVPGAGDRASPHAQPGDK